MPGLALRQFGYLAQATLRINPYHEELAAKLAVYLTIMSRLRATYRVQNLLAAVEPEATLQQAALQRQKRYKFKRRWDDALLTLHDHGWHIHFDPMTYPVALWPDWALPETMAAHLRAAGYSPGLGAAVWRGLCGAGRLAASRPRLARWPRGLSPYHAGWSPGESVWPGGWHGRASPKAKRHDHLPGAKGYFNATACQAGPGPLWVCEGAFDALALLAAGVSRVVAIFGVQGWRWDWAREVRALVFALDADVSRTAAVAPARPPGCAAGEARGGAASGRLWWAQRRQRGVGGRDPRGGDVVHPSRGARSRLAVPARPPRGLGGARRDHARGRSPPPCGRHTSSLGGAPGVPAVIDGSPRWAGRHARLTPWMGHLGTTVQVLWYDRAITGECFLSPRRVAMATMIDGESYVGRVLIGRCPNPVTSACISGPCGA